MSFIYSEILEKLLSREDLNKEEALWLMDQTMSGNLTPSQISAWLVAMRSKGETSLEIGTFAMVMRDKATPVTGINHPVMDTCGTGGDKSSLLNISTISALVLANRGVRVAKHGNRSVSSSSGSADLLEKLGYNLTLPPEQISDSINKSNFGFFFAPAFHPAMKYAGPVRKEIGIRTVFNVLGPLSNPAHAEIHLMGVSAKTYLNIMAEALVQLGLKTFMVVHSEDGLDELSPLKPTDYYLFNQNQLVEGRFDPAILGLKIQSLDELKIKNPDEALTRAQNIFEGNDLPGIEMVAVNTAAAEFLWKLNKKETDSSFDDYMKSAVPEIIQRLTEKKYNLNNII